MMKETANMIHPIYEQTPFPRHRIDTGLMGLNRLTSGLMLGNILFLQGNADGVGLTFLAAKIMAAGQNQGLRPVYYGSDSILETDLHCPHKLSKYKVDRLGLAPNEMAFEPLCLNPLESVQAEGLEYLRYPSLLVLNSVSDWLVEQSLQNSPEQLDEILLNFRDMLIHWQLKAAQSLIVLVYEPHILNKFLNAPITKLGPYFGLPSSRLDVCELKLHDHEKGLQNRYTGKVIRAQMLHTAHGPGGHIDHLYMDEDNGYTDMRTIIKIARDQGLISADQGYVMTAIPDALRQERLYDLQNYLSRERNILNQLIEQIDWEQSGYVKPVYL